LTDADHPSHLLNTTTLTISCDRLGLIFISNLLVHIHVRALISFLQ